jgi:hypothetical protein
MALAEDVAVLATLVADIRDMPLKSKVFHFAIGFWGDENYFLSPAPQAEPQAAGFSSLSPEPHAVPQAAGFSFLSPEPHAVPHAAGAPASAQRIDCALWPKPNSFERFIFANFLN